MTKTPLFRRGFVLKILFPKSGESRKAGQLKPRFQSGEKFIFLVNWQKV